MIRKWEPTSVGEPSAGYAGRSAIATCASYGHALGRALIKPGRSALYLSTALFLSDAYTTQREFTDEGSSFGWWIRHALCRGDGR